MGERTGISQPEKEWHLGDFTVAFVHLRGTYKKA